MILEAKNLWKSFDNGKGTLAVLKGLSLEVQEGELVTIMGQSGTGKTTLLNILGTLDNSDSGELKISGNHINGYNKNQLSRLRNREIGFVFQSHHLLPDFTILDNVLMPLWIKNGFGQYDKPLELLDEFGLLKIKDKTIISITHRVNTLKNFDRILELENGTIKKIYSGKELYKKLNQKPKI